MKTGKKGEVRIYVRVPKAIKKEVKKRAKEVGVSFADWTRKALVDSLN